MIYFFFYQKTMVICAAYNCNSRSDRKEPGITFHRFPIDPERKYLWIKEMKLANWSPSVNERICSKHFEKHFFYQGGAKTRLLNAAVPTIFQEFPKYMQQKKAIKRSFRETVPITSVDCDAARPSTSTASMETIESPRKKKLRRQLFKQSQKLQKKNKKIRVLGQKVKRYRKKILSLQELIKDLSKKNLISAENVLLFENMPDIVKELQNRKQKRAKYSPEI